MLPLKQPRNKSSLASAVRNADDAEVLALAAGAGVEVSLDDALLDDRVSEAIVDAALPDDESLEGASTAVEDALRIDTHAEGLLALASEVIAARGKLLGNYYPFELVNNALRYRGSTTHVYEFCLSISTVVNIAVPKYRQAITVFEQLGGLVMSCFVGCAGQYYHTGYPGSGAAIGRHLESLDQLMPGEWRWDAQTLAGRVNDGGVDAIVWKRADERPDVGSLLFVGNSGCGRTWLDSNKHRERPSDELAKILSRPKPWHLHDFLSLPFHLHDPSQWSEASNEGRFVLDRIRLTAIAEAQPTEMWAREAARLKIPLDDAIRLLNPSINALANN